MTLTLQPTSVVPAVLLRKFSRLALCLLFISGLVGCTQPAAPTPSEPVLPVKVVLVTMFEIGADEGDTAGEFQLWKARRNLTQRVPFPQSHHDLFYNPETQVLGMVTGIGTAKSATATMALGWIRVLISLKRIGWWPVSRYRPRGRIHWFGSVVILFSGWRLGP